MHEGISGESRNTPHLPELERHTHWGAVWPVGTFSCRAVPFTSNQPSPPGPSWWKSLQNFRLAVIATGWRSLVRWLESGSGTDHLPHLERVKWPLTFWNFVLCLRWQGREEERRQKRWFNVGKVSFQWENPSLSWGHKSSKGFRSKKELLSELLEWLRSKFDKMSFGGIWFSQDSILYSPGLKEKDWKSPNQPYSYNFRI